MLFSITPKSRRDELFDFENELNSLVKSIGLNPMTIVIGMRRTGKTSLLKVALNECGYPYIYIDPRFSAAPDYHDFAYLIKRSLEDFLDRCRDFRSKIVDLMKRVKGVYIRVPGFDVEISWGRQSRLDLPSLFEALDRFGESLGRPVVIAVDEAQELRKITWISFDRLFAYVYDNLTNTRVVLTGSEVGLLYRFLRVEDPAAPLYGRYIHVVKTRRLTQSESLEFLRKGFEEVGVEIPENALLRAVEVIDGVIGWLTYFGYTCYTDIDLCRGRVDEVISLAISMAKQELENFLSSRRSPRYRNLLKILATEKRWSEIKKLLEYYEGKTINDRTLNDLLRELLDLGIAEKIDDRYILADPIIRKAVERL
ncbi:MAG: ATP-binding protein [Ignisphaera sp.]